MTESNKRNLVQFGKVSAIVLPAFIAIISFAGILNGVVGGLDSAYAWVGGINLCVEGGLLYLLYKKLFKSEK